MPSTAGAGFSVLPSVPRAARPQPGGAPALREIPPDTATCPDCLRELLDPADRRYRYPFVNCTACGPRATIIDDLPYDRARTAMHGFPLCDACAAEYADPADRRFHAEPVACPACGPRLEWRAEGGPFAPAGRAYRDAALAAAEDAIAAGAIVALKGLGGYQLVCDAGRPAAVRRLRALKHRPAKPFAVMVRDLDAASALSALLPPEARTLLASPARPIVLVPRRPGTALAAGVHPGVSRVGLFLPATPLHHLLLRDLARPLVVTSGNRADEPIAIDDQDALERLSGIADGFLGHDRPIRARYDDSVVQLAAGAPAVLRRARGYAPAPLPLPVPAAEPVLAMGAQLKHTFAVAHGPAAVLSPHLGDLADEDTREAFRLTRRRLGALLGCPPPRIAAHDLHPGYTSTAIAVAGRPASARVPVQHHHAHLAACAAELGLTGRFIGVAYAGLGYGDDGTLWGGEILLADLGGYRRLGRFARAPLPGGESAVRRPGRTALGHLLGLEPLGGPALLPEALAEAGARLLDGGSGPALMRMIRRGVNCPQASSAGRLFDTAAALLGLAGETVGYEGEAAIAVEEAARSQPASVAALPWRLSRTGLAPDGRPDGRWVYDPAPTLAALLDGVATGRPAGPLAAAFHSALVEATCALVGEAVRETGLDTVCLSGGCFANGRLLQGVSDSLAREGLRVLSPRQVPCGDGGISYGQAAVAAARMKG
jgi:hydrogenase maturation protein HypF